MAAFALDASALLALLHDEPGAEVVESALEKGCAASTVNLAEVLSKRAELGSDPGSALAQLESFGAELAFHSPSNAEALSIARLRPATRDAGLSLGDRACLALALRLGVPAMTTDRAWTRVNHGVEVRLIRG